MEEQTKLEPNHENLPVQSGASKFFDFLGGLIGGVLLAYIGGIIGFGAVIAGYSGENTIGVNQSFVAFLAIFLPSLVLLGYVILNIFLLKKLKHTRKSFFIGLLIPFIIMFVLSGLVLLAWASCVINPPRW